MQTHSTKYTDMTSVQIRSSNNTYGIDDINSENVGKDGFGKSNTLAYPKFSLLTNMLISDSVSSVVAAADPSEVSDSCVPDPSEVSDSCVPTPLCSSGETTLTSHPTRQRPVHGTFTSVAEGSKMSISNPSSTLLGMLTNKQSQTVTVPLNSIVDYIGIFPTSTECSNDANIFQQWGENQSRCEVCTEHCPDRSVYKEHYLLHRSLHIREAYFKCYQCKKLLSKYAIRDHVKIHSRKTAYSCQKCAKSFLSRKSYTIHMAVHDHEKQIHTCHLCGRDFAFECDLTKHASEHQRQLSKITGNKRKSDDDVSDSDDVMEEHTKPEKGRKSVRPWRHTERSLPDPEMNEKDTISAVNDFVIKQEVKTEDPEDIDTMADPSGGKKYIRNTSDTFPEGLEEQDARTAEDVPFADIAIKQESGGVPTDGAEMCVTLPQPSREDTSEDRSQSFNSLCCGDPKSPDTRQGEDDSIREQEASEVEHIMVSGDAGDEHWIVKKADSEDEGEETDETSVKSEPSQDFLSSQIYGDVSSKQKSSSFLLSVLTSLDLHQQEGTQLVDVKTKVNDKKQLPDRSTIQDLLFQKLQNPQKSYIVKSHKEKYKPDENTKKIIPKRPSRGGKWASKGKLSPMNDEFNNEWMANYFKCPECKEVCETVGVYKEHYLFHRSLTNNDGQYVQCCECNTTVQNTYLRKHVKVHSGPFTCAICGEMYTFKSKYDTHLKMHKQEGHMYHCSICKKEFGYEYLLKRHSVIHKMFQCSMCGHTCTEKRDLEVHKRMHKTLHVCNVCNKRYSKAAALSSHMRYAHCGHREIVPELMQTGFTCDKWSTFSKERVLKWHQKTCKSVAPQTRAQNVKPLEGTEIVNPPKICDRCGAIFMNADALDRHLKCAHPNLAYICQICGKMYSKGEDLLSHKCNAHCMSSEDNEDDMVQYACIHCNEFFHTKDLLQDHCSHKCKLKTTTRKHRKCNKGETDLYWETEKQTRCRKSNRKMKKSQGNMKQQDISTFQCDICLKVFQTKKDFQKHSQSAHEQTDIKPVPCEKCHDIFKDETYLSIHIRMAHDSEKVIQGVKEDQ